MSKRTRYAVIGVATAVIVLGGGYLAFAILAGGSSPAPVSLSTSDGATPSGAVGTPGGGATSAADLAGTWQVSTNGSFVGYRVREKLGPAPALSDAVGRTSAVTGTMTIQGTSVKSVEVTADMTQLQSDRSMRDARMHTMGLETDTFPSATFVLASPMSFDAAPDKGTVVTSKATGTLTLHGVTKTVTIDIQAKWTTDGIIVVGTLPVTMADYSITPPNVGGFVSVQDHGTMEFQIVFTKA